MKPRDFLKKLKKTGVEIAVARGKGSHVRVFYQGRHTTVPFHGNTDIGPNLLRKICRQLGFIPDQVL
jgi:predicted RNA binding protein YcfA (HicA-like mRNA interferase family)